MVTISAGFEALVSFRGTEATSCEASCSVPHWPCCLLNTSFQELSAPRSAQRLYWPFGTVTSPNCRSAAVEKVVDLSAPSRQKSPGFQLLEQVGYRTALQRRASVFH